MPDVVLKVTDPLLVRDGTGPEVVGTFRDGGRSSGVVVVHGFFASRGMSEIDRAAAALAGEHDTLAIDVLGHGDSPGRFTWGREEWRQVAAATRFLAAGGRRVAVVGFSFGGYHAVRAVARGAAVERLVLVGAPADLGVADHFPLGGGFWRSLPAMLRRKRRWPRLSLPPGGAAGRLPVEEMRAVRCATLVVHGGSDWLVSRRHAERYAGEIAGARLVEIPRGLHAEYLVDSSPSEFLGALLRFLRGL